MVDWDEIVELHSRQLNGDRIGPDFPFTHWRLYFKRLMLQMCRQKFAKFGEQSEFRPGAYAISCSKISIGARVTIRPQTMLFADPNCEGIAIEIEDSVLIGSGVHIYTSNHRFEQTETAIIDQGHQEAKPVALRVGCWIGAQSIILPGVEVGMNAVVGAGSVVTRTVAPRTVVAGNPARLIHRPAN